MTGRKKRCIDNFPIGHNVKKDKRNPLFKGNDILINVTAGNSSIHYYANKQHTSTNLIVV